MTMPTPMRRSSLAAGLAVGATLLLAGCGGDGVELNGRIFDMLGVSSAAQEANRREPKMAPRQGLVLPPSTASLPAPGAGGAADAPDPGQDLRDPDRQRRLALAERDRLHKAYCSGELTWKERVASRDGSQTPTSPFGSCTLFGDSLQEYTGGTRKN
jgi:hypothetical protein